MSGDDDAPDPETEPSMAIAKGDEVLVAGLPGRFSVLDGPNRKGELRVGRHGLELWAPAARLSRATAPGAKKKKDRSVIRRKNGQAITVTASAGARRKEITLDLHRKTVPEAIALLEAALDEAIVSGLEWIEVVHGRGTGAVREAVHRFLGASRHVKRFVLIPGNDGATKVYL